MGVVQAGGGVETQAQVDARSTGRASRAGRRRARRAAALLLVALVVVLGVAPGPVAAHEASGTAPGQEIECGKASGSRAVRASLQVATQPVEISLGRSDTGWVQREVRMAWTDDCQVADRDDLDDNLVLLPGVLSGPDSSIPASAIRVESVDAFEKTVRVVVGVHRGEIEPGRYEGSLVMEAEVDGRVVARGQLAVIIKRQEGVLGPVPWWNPMIILIGAIVAGLVFGWWRAKALSVIEEQHIKLSKQILLEPRNTVAFVGALGAGITAWTLNYLQVPDFRFDASAVMSLFPVVLGATATALLALIRPNTTSNAVEPPPAAVPVVQPDV
ncbi:MAG TPA: hypothetical protein VGO78_14280 [Acidimicrobiales bacterium]|nr:hypothetical protein [Acidimicrobiales bacterium]